MSPTCFVRKLHNSPQRRKMSRGVMSGNWAIASWFIPNSFTCLYTPLHGAWRVHHLMRVSTAPRAQSRDAPAKGDPAASVILVVYPDNAAVPLQIQAVRCTLPCGTTRPRAQISASFDVPTPRFCTQWASPYPPYQIRWKYLPCLIRTMAVSDITGDVFRTKQTARLFSVLRRSLLRSRNP